MKKEYQKPELEYISLVSEEDITSGDGIDGEESTPVSPWG